MPVYNTNPQWLQQAIDSVKTQTYQDWELWCIDDHSTHLQVPFVLKNAEQADKRIHAIILDQNQGVSAATNTALNLASGTHVLFMELANYLSDHRCTRVPNPDRFAISPNRWLVATIGGWCCTLA